MMKLKISNGEYVANNVSLSINKNMTEVEADSYGWWQFVRTDERGNVIFNNSNYSLSTSGHQYKVGAILNCLGIVPVFTLNYTTANNCNLEAEIAGIQAEVDELRQAIAAKGSWLRKNAERKLRIEYLSWRIKDIKDYLATGKLPAKNKDGFYDHNSVTFKEWFLKPNGKLDVNGWKKMTSKLTSYHTAPNDLARLFELFGKKSLETLLLYRYSQDVNNMISNIDSIEYKQLLRWLKRQRHPVNILLLDKLHTYLTNKQNRRLYDTKEPVLFPMLPAIEKLDGAPDLRLIKTATDLRREGRTQSHCIGSKWYIDRCLSGHHALNYKGYTFFLSPDGSIIESSGKYNASTPDKIYDQLINLLAI